MESLTSSEWMVSIAVSSSVLWLIELKKWHRQSLGKSDRS